jgi:hypothetical protein
LGVSVEKVNSYLSGRGVYCDLGRHSCEGRNPENSVPSRLDARLRGHDEKNTLPPQLFDIIKPAI